MSVSKDKDKIEDPKVDDNAGIKMSGHILIRDAETKEEIVNKRNAIHYGNMANMIAKALTNSADSYVHYMAFGNGATSVDAAGKVIYKAPRVSEAYENSASLYSRTFQKVISNNTTTDKIEIIPGTSYTDLKITCTLGYNEPSAQDTFDTSTTNDGLYVFDELALLSYATDPTDSTMLTHVIFHPVQKSANRTIEIIYTVRVQLN
jgi:hypothetical protein|tara:strand:- start:111 stop:725 length:615 start_codon:yes stop_codon:yes gene_type:complete